jgi:hypothetical protein
VGPARPTPEDHHPRARARAGGISVHRLPPFPRAEKIGEAPCEVDKALPCGPVPLSLSPDAATWRGRTRPCPVPSAPGCRQPHVPSRWPGPGRLSLRRPTTRPKRFPRCRRRSRGAVAAAEAPTRARRFARCSTCVAGDRAADDRRSRAPRRRPSAVAVAVAVRRGAEANVTCFRSVLFVNFCAATVFVSSHHHHCVSWS